MPKFRFRLQTLQRLREMNRDELRVRLAEAFQAEQILTQQRDAVAAEAAALAATRRQLMTDGSMDVTRLLESQRYQLLLEAQSRTLAEQATRLAEEVDVRRQAVVEADRQVRVLDKLRELTTLSVEQRLVAALQRMSAHEGFLAADGRVELCTSRYRLLCELVGATRESVSLVLGRLSAEGLVERAGSTLFVAPSSRLFERLSGSSGEDVILVQAMADKASEHRELQ